MKRLATFLIIACCAIGFSRLAAQDLRFQHLTTDHGLSDNAINCVYQDRAGFLWIGTERGLDRYDGQRVDAVSGSGFAIAAITEDAQGMLWAATQDHGLLLVDRTARTAEHLHRVEGDSQSIASDQLTAVFDLNDTTLLLGSREHTLIFMDKRTRTFTYWTDSTSIDPARAATSPIGRAGWCHAITVLNEERLWIGLLNNYTALIVDRSSLRTTAQLIVKRPGSESQSCALLKEGMLYTAGWQNGIDAVPMNQEIRNGGPWMASPKTIDSPDEVLALAAWHDGSVLAGTRAFGLMRIDMRTREARIHRHRRTDPSSLPSDRIRCLLVDRAGTLWVGTANGLAFHVPRAWSMEITRIFPAENDAQPELFFHRLEPEGLNGIRAFTSNGFYTQAAQGGSFTHTPVLSHGMELQPTSRGPCGAGRCLLGTEYGVVEWNVAEERFTDVALGNGGGLHYKTGDMFQVRFIASDTVAGRAAWVIGTMGYGVMVFDSKSRDLLGYGAPPAAIAAKARFLVNDMLRDERGLYWVATSDGVFRWKNDMPVIGETGHSAGSNAAKGILAPGSSVQRIIAHNGAVWAVTRDARVLRLIGDSAIAHSAPWPISSTSGLRADDKGRLWVTTSDGLLRFDPRDASFIRVPVNDGHEFRKLTRATTKLPSGRIAFAASNAILSFDPTAFDSLPAIPNPFIATASVAGAPLVIHNDRVTLSYRAGVIDIGISAMAFGFPQPLMFEYRLDGVESEWRSTTATELIRYAGVPVGEHHLLVRVHDPFGRTGPERVLLTITVDGPFWQQWWFYAIAALTISIGAYAWSRYRLAQALKLQAVRNRIASDLHDEVGSSLSSITIGSKLAAQLSTSESPQVKEILARIGETSSESLRSISDIVWAIDPKNDPGEALVKRMRRIANELLESKGVDVSFSIAGGVEELKLPMNARKEIVLIYKEAVHNASKYSGATRVQVSLHLLNGALSLVVHDNGKGFDPVLHPDGHGLGSMKRRAEALGAALALRSAPGSGVAVELEVSLMRILD